MGRTHNFLKSHLLARHACSVPSDVAEGGQQLFIFCKVPLNLQSHCSLLEFLAIDRP